MSLEQLVGTVELPDLRKFLPEFILLVLAFTLFTLELTFKGEKKRRLLLTVSYAGYALVLLSLFVPWRHPGDTFYASFTNDALAVTVKLFATLLTMAVLAFVNAYYRHFRSFYGEFYYLLAFTLLGVFILASSYNLVILYVALELVSVGFYVLTALFRGSTASKEGAFKYLVLGGLSIALASYGAAFMYVYAGSLDLREILSYEGQDLHYLILGLVFFLIGFAVKIGAVPFHFWLPDAYQGAPTPVTALMASVGKLAFFIPLLRVMPLVQEKFSVVWTVTVGVIAALTMLFGNFVALVQKDVKRMLAYSSIAHSGYLLAAAAVAKELGMKALLYFLLVYGVMAAGSFLVLALLERGRGWRNELEYFSGLRFTLPAVAFAFFIYLIALLGVPPTAGFAGKALVFMALSFDELWWLAFVMILSTAVSTGYYVRLVVLMFMKEPVVETGRPVSAAAERLSLALTALASVLLGALPGLIWFLIEASVASILGR
ncbi:MAG: NADH-quinone oxidoreductase subunit N [Aquificae bacterium]|nr:NADH-quinone oxidoreductase subunit N [Aquificota bacterium]